MSSTTKNNKKREHDAMRDNKNSDVGDKRLTSVKTSFQVCLLLRLLIFFKRIRG